MVEMAIGAQTLAELTDDDADGVADPAVLEWCFDVATDQAFGLLRPAYPDERQVVQLVADDSFIRHAVVQLVVGIAGERRPGFLSADGTTPYSAWRDKGAKALREVTRGEYQPKGEVVAGRNQIMDTDVARTPRGAIPKRTVIAGTRDDPNPGGF